MPRKRQTKNANGLGTIRWNNERGRYEGRITLSAVKLPDGRWRQDRRTVTGATQGEVRDKMDRLRVATEVAPGLPTEVTVAAYLTHWLTDIIPTSVSRDTVKNYTDIVNTYIVPTIGRRLLSELTPAHVRQMLANVRGRGGRELSPNTLRLIRSVLRRALRMAEHDGLVTRNVAALVDGVRVGRPEGRTLTPDQARQLLGSIEGHPLGPLVVVLLSLGLRKGEALGLTWDDFDAESKPAKLTIRRSLHKDRAGATYLAEPKTAGSRRTLYVPPPVVAVLRAHRTSQHAERLAFGPGWGKGWPNLMFTSSIGTPLDPDRVNRTVQAMTEDAGLGRWTPHELRHSAASLMLAQRVELKTVSETLGHSSIRVTADVYAHLLEPAKAEAADAMTAALFS